MTIVNQYPVMAERNGKTLDLKGDSEMENYIMLDGRKFGVTDFLIELLRGNGERKEGTNNG